MKNIGIYVHIPFCKSKCYYCDFTSFAHKEELVDKYIDALIGELKHRAKENYCVKTIYIGGGTPSYINQKYITKILNTIRGEYNVAEHSEVTIEVNPGTVNNQKLKEYIQAGINRLSIGLQSANDKILKTIGRIHSFKDYLNTINLAKQMGFTNINTDIIIGLPNQLIQDVQSTLETLIKLKINHISVYSLIVEEGTKIEDMICNKEIFLPSEEDERKMYWKAKKMLEKSGYIHYEISNFAKPGEYSRHNLDCWNQKEYLGFGVSAASYIHSKRFSNISCIEEYIKNIKENEYDKNVIIEEVQTKEDKQNEFIMLGLRKIEGVIIKDFIQKFGLNPLERYKEELINLEERGLIIVNNECIRLSDKGIDLGNQVWQEFI